MRVRTSLIILFLIFALAACNDGNGSYNNNSGGGNINPPPTSDGNPQPAKYPDLEITNASFVNSGVGFESYGYNITLTVRNNGDAETAFDAQCGWTCPGGTIGNSFVSYSGAYIGAHQERQYAPTVFGPMCDPVPAAVTNFSCIIDPGNEVRETNENNNSWAAGMMQLP